MTVQHDALYRLYVAPPTTTSLSDYRLDCTRYGWEIEDLERVERIYTEGGYATLVLSMSRGIDHQIR